MNTCYFNRIPTMNCTEEQNWSSSQPMYLLDLKRTTVKTTPHRKFMFYPVTKGQWRPYTGFANLTLAGPSDPDIWPVLTFIFTSFKQRFVKAAKSGSDKADVSATCTYYRDYRGTGITLD